MTMVGVMGLLRDLLGRHVQLRLHVGPRTIVLAPARPLPLVPVMAYILPTFNLLCNIGPAAGSAPRGGYWPGTPLPFVHRITNQPCALQFGRKSQGAIGSIFETGPAYVSMYLLLPPLTDIRGVQVSVVWDWVECPAGSGRFYAVSYVDDIGKGYPNEHRCAEVFSVVPGGNTQTPGLWVAPYP